MEPENRENPVAPRRFQLHLVLPYKFQPREHRQVAAWLDKGYRIEQLQRISDREVVVTLASA